MEVVIDKDERKKHILYPFEESFFLDQVLSDETTTLDEDCSINELTVNKVSDLLIKLKDNSIILSSHTPFYIHRKGKKLIINRVPVITSRIGIKSSGLYDYERYYNNKIPSKEYSNHHDDKEYKSFYTPLKYGDYDYVLKIDKNFDYHTQIGYIKEYHDKAIDIIILNNMKNEGYDDCIILDYIYRLLIYIGYRDFLDDPESVLREYKQYIDEKYTLNDITIRKMERFIELKKSYYEQFGDDIMTDIVDDIEIYKHWMLHEYPHIVKHMNDDLLIYSNYNELHSQKHIEWTINGNINLQFYNVNNAGCDVIICNETLDDKLINNKEIIRPGDLFNVTIGKKKC